MKQLKTMGNTKYKVGDRICSKYHKPSEDLEIIEVMIMRDGNYCYRIKNHQKNNTYLMWGYDMDDYKLVKEESKPEPKFKVGDKVTLNNKLCSITWVCWECNNIYYQVQGIDDIFTKKVTANELKPYKEEIECKVEEKCPQDFIEKYCQSCDTRCDGTKEYLNGCPCYNAYRMSKKQNNIMEDETKLEPKFKVGDILFYRGETCGYLKVEEIREENGEIRYYENSRNLYLVENDPNVFADKVCSVETEEIKPIIDFTIKATDTKGKVEVVIPDGYGYVVENDKLYFINKKKSYPTTFLGCCDVLGIEDLISRGVKGYKSELLDTFQKLFICRDAYWQMAGEEMGLGKPWEPDWSDEKQDKYGFHNEVKYTIINSATFVFPTAEMRDAFKENFDPYIEICKEFR